jgi:hypothetical protein
MTSRLKFLLRANKARLSAVATRSHAARLRARGNAPHEPSDLEPVSQPNVQIVLPDGDSDRSPEV